MSHRTIVADLETHLLLPTHYNIIVNAANEELSPGGGVCGVLHRLAGPMMAYQCGLLRSCPTGDFRMTSAFDLPADFVFHAVGPKDQDPDKLRLTYRSVFNIPGLPASFLCPYISTGIYGFPLDEGMKIAHGMASQFPQHNITFIRRPE